MVNLIILSLLFIISSCQVNDQAASSAPVADDICSGKTILGIAGTADCSGGGGGVTFLSFASRRDNNLFPTDPVDFIAFFATRDEVATLADEHIGTGVFATNHSVIPNPLYDSDGRYGDGRPFEKMHYLERIAVNEAGKATRADIAECGTTSGASIEDRISDCATENGLWAFYDGKKYGQDGEGDWKLVTVVDNAGTKYEVWRDERTKLLWSDKTSVDNNWFQAAGYHKPGAISLAEANLDSTDYQTSATEAISVCPDVTAGGAIAAGGGTPGVTYSAPANVFHKGGLSHPQVTWRLPSINDWQLANVNGIRKVLPNMDNIFWSASSDSGDRYGAWVFSGGNGVMYVGDRYFSNSVRCVAPSRD